MLILTKEDIKKCITMQETIETCKSAMLSYSLKKTNIPLRTNISVANHNGQVLFMPGSPTSRFSMISTVPTPFDEPRVLSTVSNSTGA